MCGAASGEEEATIPKEVLQAFFPDYEPVETRAADYRWRAFVPKCRAADVIAAAVGSIDYGNFKDSVKDDRLYDAYLGCWSIMHRYQADVHGDSDNRRYDLPLYDDERDAIAESYPPGWPIGGLVIDADSAAFKHDIDDEQPPEAAHARR